MELIKRPRRLRGSANLRKMVRETRMDKSSLIYPELRPFFGRKVQKYWNFHPSVLSLWRIRADCTRPFLISAAMTGWYLQVLQAWKFSSGKWRKRRSTCVLLEMQKSR